MADHDINVLLTSFAGLGLPRTLSLSFRGSTKINEVVKTIHNRLPLLDHPITITTTSNRCIDTVGSSPLTTLLPSEHAVLLPLRLSAPVFGGKGGFGSQLRAAGGRMSSRKNRSQQNQPQNGSNRNLDGRRLRTVDAAKKLADYLSKKPEMEEKEKEERRKKWETVVELANKREEDIKSGKMGSGQGRLDAEYVESKGLAEERTREAVIQAMRNGGLKNERIGSESFMDTARDESDDETEDGSSGSSGERHTENGGNGGRTFFGWDDDEDEDDDEVDEGENTNEEENGAKRSLAPDVTSPHYKGKGKAKAK